MSSEYHGEDKKTIGPLVLQDVQVSTIKKVIEVPVYKDVETIRFVKKEKPTIEFIKTQKPTTEFIVEQAETVEFVPKQVETTEFIVSQKPTFEFIKTEQETIKYVPVKKEYDMPVPVEKPYDVPVVSMDLVSKAAKEATALLAEAKKLAEELRGMVDLLNESIKEIKETLPSEIKVPKIVEEEFIVRVPKIESETVKVVGKIIAREG